jgi:hypothetical protein
MSPVRNQPSGMASRGRLRVVPVALHDVVAADRDLADPADADVLAVLVEELHLAPGDGNADGAGLRRPARHVERGDGRGLRQSIAFEDLGVELLLERPLHLRRHRRAAGATGAQVGGVEGCRSSGWCRIAAYIVGTPSMTVTFSLAIVLIASEGSKRGISASEAPAMTAACSRRPGRRRGRAAGSP